MGCCIVGALIMFYVFDSWRRVRAFFGIRDAADQAPPAMIPRRPSRLWPVLGLVLALEIVTAASWLASTDATQIDRVVGYVSGFL